MPIHDWTRVGVGTFHDFHSGWIIHVRSTGCRTPMWSPSPWA